MTTNTGGLITLTHKGREALKKFFNEVYGISFSEEFYACFTEVPAKMGKAYAETLLTECCEQLVKWGRQPMAEDMRTPEIMQKHKHVFTEYSSRFPATTTVTVSKPPKYTPPAVIAPFAEPLELNPNSNETRQFNKALDFVMSVLDKQKTVGGEMLFTGKYILRFDSRNGTLLSCSPQVETFTVRLTDPIDTPPNTPDGDEGVG